MTMTMIVFCRISQTLGGIPLLVLGNKNDLPQALDVHELIDRLELRELSNREVCCYCISCKNETNIDITIGKCMGKGE